MCAAGVRLYLFEKRKMKTRSLAKKHHIPFSAAATRRVSFSTPPSPRSTPHTHTQITMAGTRVYAGNLDERLTERDLEDEVRGRV